MSLTLNWQRRVEGYYHTRDGDLGAMVSGSGCNWEWAVWRDGNRLLESHNYVNAYNAKRAAERAIKRIRKAATP